ncbi:hypothetical protein ABIA03_004283 [Bradyrhizobium yuanmingense]
MEIRGDALAQFARRQLGECDGRDRPRIDAAREQHHHATCEQGRFAGAGCGLDQQTRIQLGQSSQTLGRVDHLYHGALQYREMTALILLLAASLRLS